jgi:hypothetical protein
MLSVSPFAGFAKPLAALGEWLLENHYSQHAAESIVAHAGRHGTPFGSPYLHAGDEAGASAAFVDAMEPVPYDSIDWGAVVPPELEDWADGPDSPPIPGRAGRIDPAARRRWQAAELGVAPISGGAPEPFEPSEADWADYRRYAEELEARAALARGDEALYGYE